MVVYLICHVVTAPDQIEASALIQKFSNFDTSTYASHVADMVMSNAFRVQTHQDSFKNLVRKRARA